MQWTHLLTPPTSTMSSVSLANESRRFDDEGGDVVLLDDHTPINAPPPAPPLPPPLPVESSVKRRVRSFYWKPIPEDRVKQHDGPNLWTLGRQSREPAFHIDVRAIEELFGQREDAPTPTATGGKTVGRGRASVRDLRQQVRHKTWWGLLSSTKTKTINKQFC